MRPQAGWLKFLCVQIALRKEKNNAPEGGREGGMKGNGSRWEKGAGIMRIGGKEGRKWREEVRKEDGREGDGQGREGRKGWDEWNMNVWIGNPANLLTSRVK